MVRVREDKNPCQLYRLSSVFDPIEVVRSGHSLLEAQTRAEGSSWVFAKLVPVCTVHPV